MKLHNRVQKQEVNILAKFEGKTASTTAVPYYLKIIILI